MTKPTKKTVDYFPHDVRHGKSLFIVQRRYGNDGYAAWFKLLEMLGSQEGHYLNFADAAQWEYYLACTFLEEDKTNMIFALFAKLGMIDAALWEQSRIVWSENYIKNLSDLYSRRAVKLPTKADIMPAITPLSGINEDIYPQNKVNKTKVNKSITTKPPLPPFQGGAPATPASQEPKATETALKAPEMAHTDAIAMEAIKYLNLRAGRAFRADTEGLLKYPRARIKEGASLDILKLVVDYKVWDWKTKERGLDAKDMTPWLRPDTLFNSTKFWVYAEEAAALKIKKQVKIQVHKRMVEEGKNQEVIRKELDAVAIAEIDRRKAALKAKYGPLKYILHMADPVDGYAHLM